MFWGNYLEILFHFFCKNAVFRPIILSAVFSFCEMPLQDANNKNSRTNNLFICLSYYNFSPINSPAGASVSLVHVIQIKLLKALRNKYQLITSASLSPERELFFIQYLPFIIIKSFAFYEILIFFLF